MRNWDLTDCSSNDEEEIQQILNEGWEPFAGTNKKIYFRKLVRVQLVAEVGSTEPNAEDIRYPHHGEVVVENGYSRKPIPEEEWETDLPEPPRATEAALAETRDFVPVEGPSAVSSFAKKRTKAQEVSIEALKKRYALSSLTVYPPDDDGSCNIFVDGEWVKIDIEGKVRSSK